MFGFVDHALEKLVDMLLDPVYKWLTHASLRTRLLFGILVIVCALSVYHNNVSLAFGEVNRLYSVADTHDLASSLSTKQHQVLSDSIEDMVIDLDGKLTEKGHGDPVNVWTASQIVVAIRSHAKAVFDVQDMANYINKEMSVDCKCWREYSGAPGHTAATAWVLLAISVLHIPEKDEILGSLLDHQNPYGWWPIYYSATNNPENESTYATAMAAWALEEHLQQGMVLPTNKARVRTELARARAWLLSKEIGGKARWPDYPGSPDGSVNEIGLSGLVLHVLHRLGPKVDPSLDQEWLDNLPNEFPSAVDADRTDHPIFLENGQQIKDSTRYYKAHWIIIADADAFSNGSLAERIGAFASIEKAIRKVHQSKVEALPFAWDEAEMLSSLRYLNGEIVL